MGIGERDLGAFNTGTAGKVERGMSILAYGFAAAAAPR
jgi:hypothetical protein